MVSHEDDSSPSGKRKPLRSQSKVSRACDLCRKKKIRCDGSESVDAYCTQCKEAGSQCSYVEGSTRRAPPKWYIERLEGRIEKLEGLLEKLHPGVDFPELGPRVEIGSWTHNTHEFSSRTSNHKHGASPLSVSSAEDLFDEETLGLQDLKLSNNRFYGATSACMLFLVAVNKKPEFQGQDTDERLESVVRNGRDYYWTTPPWERKLCEALKSVKFNLPPPDLASELINLYFQHSNPFFPLLHRPIFIARYQEGHHEKDIQFAALLLLVCAVGARWSDDPRVREGENQHSAGWGYFEQVQRLPQPHLAPCTLIKLQVSTLSTIYMLGCSNPQVTWSLVGFALRSATEVGLHTRSHYENGDTVENELWKRVFWCLVALDRVCSLAVGRPCAIYDEEIDADVPDEVDDDYWPGHEPSHDTPSLISFFNSFNSLLGIFSNTRRRLNAANRDQQCKTVDPANRKQQILDEMEGALAIWLKDLPHHITWDPHQPDSVFARQSALLHTFYYQGFIRLCRFANVTQCSPAMIKCTNAARACARIIETFQKWDPGAGAPFNISGVALCALTLLLSMWGESGPGTAIKYSELRSNVKTCIDVLERSEHRWFVAGRYTDGLKQLLSGNTEATYPDLDNVHKRGRSGSSSDIRGRTGKIARHEPAWSRDSLPTPISTPGHTPRFASSSSSFLDQSLSSSGLNFPRPHSTIPVDNFTTYSTSHTRYHSDPPPWAEEDEKYNLPLTIPQPTALPTTTSHYSTFLPGATGSSTSPYSNNLTTSVDGVGYSRGSYRTALAHSPAPFGLGATLPPQHPHPSQQQPWSLFPEAYNFEHPWPEYARTHS